VWLINSAYVWSGFVTRILIVDDSPDFRTLIEKVLVRAGYDVVTGEDGEDGMRQAIIEQPDLILLDFMMPGKNGLEVFRELRENDNTAGIPVIMITAFTAEFQNATMEALRYKLDDFISKPVSPKELISRIEALFAARRIAGMQ
jgi:DNA-binding response OmpR family regulator